VINGEIKNVLTVGISNKTSVQIEYFKKLFKLLSSDNFVVSYYYKETLKNILFANIDYAFPFLYKVIDTLLPIKKSTALKINVFNTRCEPHTIPNLLYLRYSGVDRIYFHQCSPMLINPALVEFMLENFSIRHYTTPENDIKSMLE